MNRTISIALLAAVAFCGAGRPSPARAAETTPAVPVPPPAEILQRLKPGHPRLLASQGDFARLKAQIATNATLKQWHSDIQRQAERILPQPPSKYEIPDGLRLLSTSRRVVQRVQTLGLLYQLNGDKQYAERAWTELKAAAEFKDWNPRHFLDTAEMTHAFAIGYDWFYDFWTPEQRGILRTAMVEKGIKLANEIQNKNTWWARARHNWNQVCNGGIGMGALALADEVPDDCGRFLAAALKSIQLPMAEFAPDGAWAEGPGYWSYATSYNVVFLAALQTALGTDFGLGQMPGFSEAAMFPIYASGPTGNSFDYADAHADVIRAPQMFWFARRFDRPVYAWYERQRAYPSPLDLLWFDARGEAPTPATLPLDKYFRNSEVAMLRSAWGDRNALWVGLKAGDNKANHSNLDLGSFVLEALGHRWAEELGADDYNLPGYFGNQRWTYYRLRAEGHNTLVINPATEPDQDPRAVAKITRFESRPQKAFVITDLTTAYAKDVRAAQRGIAMLGRAQVLVQDDIEALKPSQVWWFMHTPARIELAADKRSATLTLGNDKLSAQILSPPAAGFTVMDAKSLPTSPNPEMQAKNLKVSKLAIHLTDATEARLAVLFNPLQQDVSKPAPTLQPLSQWKAE